MQRPSYAMFWCGFCLQGPGGGEDCNNLGMGCSWEGSKLLPDPPALQCSLCWEQPLSPRYHVAARLASSSIILQRGASAPPSPPSGPREAFWWENEGYAWSCLRGAQEQCPGFGVQHPSSCFSQRLWTLAWRGCAEQLVLKETGFPLAGPSPPFASRWAPSALLNRGTGISVSRRGCSYRTCAVSWHHCRGRAAMSAQPGSRQWRIQWDAVSQD